MIVNELVVLIVIFFVISVLCNGGFNGIFIVIVSGGVGLYNYFWLFVGGMSVFVIGFLVGMYIVIVIDNNGCIIMVFGMVI